MEHEEQQQEEKDAGVAESLSKTAMAAVLAGSIAVGANAVTPDQINLPDPVPIVQTIELDTGGDIPDDVADDEEQTKQSNWKRAVKFLLIALATMMTAAGIAFGALQGCASCTGSIALPAATSSEQEATQSM